MTSPTPDLAEVMARVEKVERRNRWLLVAVGLAAVGVALAWALANTTPTAQAQGAKVIRANQFIVEDETGNLRAMLNVDKAGPGLTLGDENGDTRVMVAVSQGIPGVVLRDENGKIRVMLAAMKEGPTLSLADATGKWIWSQP